MKSVIVEQALNKTFDNQITKSSAIGDDSNMTKRKEHFCFIEELCLCDEEPIHQQMVDPKKKERANHVISSSA